MNSQLNRLEKKIDIIGFLLFGSLSLEEKLKLKEQWGKLMESGRRAKESE